MKWHITRTLNWQWWTKKIHTLRIHEKEKRLHACSLEFTRRKSVCTPAAWQETSQCVSVLRYYHHVSALLSAQASTWTSTIEPTGSTRMPHYKQLTWNAISLELSRYQVLRVVLRHNWEWWTIKAATILKSLCWINEESTSYTSNHKKVRKCTSQLNGKNLLLL